jgi:hypothetical protein
MTRNVTLKLDEAILRDARILAAKRGQSLSAFLSDHLTEVVQQDKRYEEAKGRALARLAKGFHLGGTPLSREEIYDRRR